MATLLSPLEQLRAADSHKVRITDIKTMLLNGPRTYTLVKVETESGLYGIAEAYGSPGLGIVEAIHAVKEFFIGKDPLQIDRLYTVYRYTDGAPIISKGPTAESKWRFGTWRASCLMSRRRPC